MAKVGVVTDSNSGITQEEASRLGIRVLPMTFYIDGQLFREGVDLDRDEFFARQAAGADILTSQPSPADLEDLWDEALGQYDEILHIPMSSGLSGSCEAAEALAQEYGGRVRVIDNLRISVPLRFAINDALEMINAGLSAERVEEILLRDKSEAAVYLAPDTLTYLKKGGRLTPAAAALGTILGIKPVLGVAGGKLDAHSKVRGMKAAKKEMLDAIEAEINGRFRGKKIRLGAAYTCSRDEAILWKREIEDRFPGLGEVTMDPLTLQIACHTGPGAVGVGCAPVLEF